MKIGIITMQGICNYGSVLQTLATQIFFEKAGLNVIIFNYLRDNSTTKNILKKVTSDDNFFKSLVKKGILLPSLLKQKKVFSRFNKKYLNLTKEKFFSEIDFEKNIPDVDVYCTGSDQVWNYDWNKGFKPELFLSFVPNDKIKVSFSSSIGRTNFHKNEIDLVKKALLEYDLISVREKSAIKAVEEIGITNVNRIIDPSLLIDKSIWLSLASKKRIIKEDYILVYQLNKNKEFDSYIRILSKKKRKKIIRICYRYDQLRLYGRGIVLPKVEDFLNLFIFADCVITDSFHATAFSINLEKNFICVFPEKFSSRMNDLLTEVNLIDRKLDDFADFSLYDKKIDFQYSNNFLKSERSRAKEYVSSIVSLVKEGD